MGSMHTGLEDRFYHYGKLAAFYRERARGGVGPDRHRRHLAEPPGLAAALRRHAQLRRRRAQPPQRHPRRARRGRQDRACRSCTRGATATSRWWCRRRAIKSPISPFQPARAERARASKRPSPPTCAARGWRKQAGYDGVEVMGSEGYLLNQFLCARTNRRTDRWGGADREPHAPAGRDRAPHPRRRRAPTSSSCAPLGARPGRRRQYLGRDGAGGAGAGSGPAPPS